MFEQFSIRKSGALQKIKGLFFRLIDVIHYNPLVHRVTVCASVAAVISGAFFLVYFAIVSPEFPPENLISTITDISENHRSHMWSDIVLSSSEDDWAELTAFNDKEFEKGAGSQAQDRSRDFEYPVRPGETLSEIAYAYDIPYDFLAWYNKITNANRIRVGTVLIIPSLENIEINQIQYQQQRSRQQQTAQPTRTVRNIEISYEGHSSGAGLGITVHFYIVNPPSDLRSYEWEMGDGRRSFRESPSYEYTTPRTYVVNLTAQDGAGVIYRSNYLYIDIPHPTSTAEYSTTRFVTLSSPDEYFVVNGTIKKVSRYTNIEDVLDISESDQFLTKVRFKKSGYFGVTIEERGREQYYSIFVSPIPTMHVDYAMSSFNWYRTQFNTGTPSNCGPASASMAISWATGNYYPVSAVRQAIGWHDNGGTSFDELIRVIRNQGINASIQPLRTAQNIRDIIDSGGIAIILFLTDGVRTARSDPATDLFGKYYNDSVGHYVVVKGYSMNGEYFVIHDPIPSDWGANSFRYPDEISMMGRNRYFSAAEVLRSLRRNEMIVVPGMN
ncbi:MAG: LysM peptidoglycan-binding domain-containing protein [Treponema sp.]|nr:LysM peptidoglycan-binding domain-containing protein [Treponema sp.]